MRWLVPPLLVAVAGALRTAPLRVAPLRAAKDDFSNPVPALQKALEMAPQFKEGRRVKFGVFSDTNLVERTESERAELRKNAAESLTNIDDEERARRKAVGSVLSVASFAVGFLLVYNNAGFGARFATLPLNWFAFSFLESAKTGL